MSEDHEWIGSADAARILQRSVRTVHRLKAAGELRPVTVAPGGPAGSFLFRREDVEAYKTRQARALMTDTPTVVTFFLTPIERLGDCWSDDCPLAPTAILAGDLLACPEHVVAGEEVSS